MCRIFAAAALCLLGPACSVTRHIPEGQYLVQRVKIEDDESTPRRDRITASDLEKYVRQTPNKRFQFLRLAVRTGRSGERQPLE